MDLIWSQPFLYMTTYNIMDAMIFKRLLILSDMFD